MQWSNVDSVLEVLGLSEVQRMAGSRATGDDNDGGVGVAWTATKISNVPAFLF